MSLRTIKKAAYVFTSIAAASSIPLATIAQACSEHPIQMSAAPVEPILIQASAAPSEPSLAEVRALTERFEDVEVALAEGYIRDPGNLCDTAEMMGQPTEFGVVGIHFFRPDLLGITAPPNPRVDGTGTHTDFRQPSILIYEPQADGSLDLVAVENLVFAEAWHAAGHDAPPTFHGVAYDTMIDDPATAVDEAHMFEPHYDRHVWIYRENPNGVFAQYNPSATCEHHQNGGGHAQHASGN